MLVNGDSSLIITPGGKTVLIDTGEQDNVLLEYLLDRRIKKVDYLMISHFDSDHSGKAVEIIEKLNVKNIIISKQSEISKQFEDIIKVARQNKVNIIQVQAGDTVKIGEDIYFEILWPKTEKTIKENPLNNNSIVAKITYKDFSVLFTGDIEKEAEEKLLNEYDESILTSTVLKIAHHGSSTSSTEQFIKTVNPKVALIGVGKNNKFGHPNEEVLERLKTYGIKIFRTDEYGEIIITVKINGKIKIETNV